MDLRRKVLVASMMAPVICLSVMFGIAAAEVVQGYVIRRRLLKKYMRA